MWERFNICLGTVMEDGLTLNRDERSMQDLYGFSPLPVNIYTRLSIITTAKKKNHIGRSGHHTLFKDTSPAQVLREHSKIYRPHSARVKLHLLNWNIPPSVIQYGLCSCLWHVCVITHVCHASAWGDTMQRSKRWLTARQHCNWATRCWSIPASSTLRHLNTSKLHVLKTITEHVIAVSRALITN